MEKKTTRFLNISLILVSLFCIVIFISQTIYINYMGENAIRQLGIFYMQGISEQVSSHFGTTIELRLSQVESIVNSVPPGRYTGKTPMQIGLTYNARSVGFEYLAFYTEDGTFQMLYGSQVTADVPEALRRSVQGGKYDVSAGKDAKGTPIVLIGVPAHYSLNDGSTSIALVAGFPTSYLNDTLENNIQSDNIEYSIIRDNGSYVLNNSAIEENNYFDRVENLYKNLDGKTPSQYIQELRGALETDKNYTSEVLISGVRWNVYCTKLPNSDWHMLFKISHNTLDETINLLQRKWSYSFIGGYSLIICALLLVFLGYYRLTKKQMYALDDARKTAEQAMLSAERSNKAKIEFLSNMSHDIRTPMNGIMGMTSIAIESLNNPPRVRSCLKRIHVSSQHLMGLINDMLDITKIETGNFTLNMEPLSLRDVTTNIFSIIQPQVQEKEQHFDMYIHDVYHENLCSDRVRLSQILLNILSNSVKFTPKGGMIRADLYEEPSPKGNDYIRSHLHVEDTGIGMSEEFLSKIFDPFSREDIDHVNKEVGAGMGMAITKHIVDTMGGSINVTSEQGKGSHFHIAIDMEKTVQQENPMHLPNCNILVIDDDETAANLAVSALASIGLQAESTPDIKQAVRMTEERRGKTNPYHIILLDWDIQQQDGIRIAKELSDHFGRELPILLLTDGEWNELEENAAANGIHDLISKPLFRSNLYCALRPLTDTPEPLQDREEEPREESHIDLTGKRILVAEDNELNWEVANAILSRFGLEMEWAENGQICVEKFEQSPPEWYDAILMDLRMPVMTGFEASAAIRRLNRNDAQTIPIIAISANAFEEDIQKCLDHGMNAHTAKPINPEKIFSLLEQYLHEKRVSPPGIMQKLRKEDFLT